MEACKQKSLWNLTFFFGTAQWICRQSATNPLVLVMVRIFVKCIRFQERILVLLSKQLWQLYCRNRPWNSILPHCMRKRVACFSQLDWNTLFCLSWQTMFFFHTWKYCSACIGILCICLSLVAWLDASKTEINFKLKILVLSPKIPERVYSWRVLWFNRN